MNAETSQERANRFSKIWAISRADAGKTQEFMANGLGISKKTVQNWENGVTAPDLFMGSEWFRVLGRNPLPYYLSYLFPNLFGEIGPEEDDKGLCEALTALVQNLTVKEQRQLLFLMVGQHGSSWYSLLQFFTAHCHTSMQARFTAARLTAEFYEIDKALNQLVCPDDVLPDMDFLRNSVEEAKQAVISQSAGYTNVKSHLK